MPAVRELTREEELHWLALKMVPGLGMRRAAHDTAGGIFGDVLSFVLDNAIARPIAFFLGELNT
jgi:hypothetical protein